MDYRKKIKEEWDLIEKTINNPELDGLAIFSCYRKNHARTYVCTDTDTLIKMLASSALQNNGMEYALRAALDMVDNLKKQYENGGINPALN